MDILVHAFTYHRTYHIVNNYGLITIILKKVNMLQNQLDVLQYYITFPQIIYTYHNQQVKYVMRTRIYIEAHRKHRPFCVPIT